MASEWKIDLENATRLKTALRLAPKIAAEEIVGAMLRSVLYVEREVVRRFPVDEGRARASVSSDIQGEGTEIRGIVASEGVEYVPYLEHGTRGHWPPHKPIEDWVRRKGLWMDAVASYRAKAKKPSHQFKAARKRDSQRRKATRYDVPQAGSKGRLGGQALAKERAIQSITFLVRRAIARRGGKKHAMFEEGWKASRERIQENFRGAFARIKRRAGG